MTDLLKFANKVFAFAFAKSGKYMCCAPQCSRLVDVSRTEAARSIAANGRVYALCPEHLERMTAGRISDGDPATNPDLSNDESKVTDK